MEQILAQITEIFSERDRAFIITAGAKIDYLLRQILVQYMRPYERKGDDPLLDGISAPLGDFSARTLIAFRLKIIDDGTFRVLRLFRKIRNDCAHDWDPINLHMSSIKDTLSEIVSPIRDLPEYATLQKIAEEMKPKMKGMILEEAFDPLINFLIITSLILYNLEQIKSKIKEVNEVPSPSIWDYLKELTK